MLDVGLSSTDQIAAFFVIAPAVAERATRKAAALAAPRKRSAAASTLRTTPKPAPATGGVQQVIEDALRAAGLMR